MNDLEVLEALNKGYVDSVQNSDVAWFDAHLAVRWECVAAHVTRG